jgi:predicted anti-sigma-YlaC factor YlaD
MASSHHVVIVGVETGREVVVGLTARERAALHQLESQLTGEDPVLAAYLASGWRQRVPLRRAGYLFRVLLPMLVGVQVAVVGGMAGSGLLIMVGLLYAVLAPCGALLIGAWRR